VRELNRDQRIVGEREITGQTAVAGLSKFILSYTGLTCSSYMTGRDHVAGAVVRRGIGIVQPFTPLEFAVGTAKSVSALLSAIGRISVAPRRCCE
jgi:hypothetical protein